MIRAATLLVLAAIPLGCRSAAAGSELDLDARREILELLEAQVRDWNKGDLEGFLRGYLNSSTLSFYGGGTVVSGIEALRERYERNYRSEGKEMGHLAFHAVVVDVLAADAVLVRGRWEVVTSSETLGGLFTLLFRRVGRDWRIVHDHTSSRT